MWGRWAGAGACHPRPLVLCFACGWGAGGIVLVTLVFLLCCDRGSGCILAHWEEAPSLVSGTVALSRLWGAQGAGGSEGAGWGPHAGQGTMAQGGWPEPGSAWKPTFSSMGPAEGQGQRAWPGVPRAVVAGGRPKGAVDSLKWPPASRGLLPEAFVFRVWGSLLPATCSPLSHRPFPGGVSAWEPVVRAG